MEKKVTKKKVAKKECPYCGEEILATAKKCKHCGEWLDEEIDDEEIDEDDDDESVSARDTMRGAIEEANWNEENSAALPVQAGIIAIIMGFVCKSWWAGLGTFFGMIILILLPRIGVAVCVILSILYGYVGYVIGAYFFSTSAGWVIAIVVGLSTLAMNLSSRKWFKDF